MGTGPSASSNGRATADGRAGAHGPTVALPVADGTGLPGGTGAGAPRDNLDQPDGTHAGSGHDAIPAVEIGSLEVRATLPIPQDVPAEAARWVQDADADIARRRYESALDLTMRAEAAAPTFLPLFVRHAELLVVTDRPRDAVRLAEIVGRLAELRADRSFAVDLLRILAHAEPTTARLVDLARGALGIGEPQLVARYVPNAVAILARERSFDAARELAKCWRDAAPGQPEAAFALVRELLRQGDFAAALGAIDPRADHPLSLTAALAAQAAAGHEDQWTTTAQLVRLVRAAPPARLIEVQRHLEQLAPLVPEAAALPVHRAVIALAGEDAAGALRDLADAVPASLLGSYVAAVCAARAANALGDNATAVTALRTAFAAVLDANVAAFAARATLFDPSADVVAVGQELAAALLRSDDSAGAADVYRQLLEQAPQNSSLARAYAEALGRSGARDEALGRLAALLRHQEEAHQRTAALETLQTIVRIAPGNVAYRSRLVEAYIQSGRVADAVGELYILAQLLERQQRIPDAVSQLQRAAEIAVLTGEWSKVDRIFRYMVRLVPDDLGARHAAAATYLQHGQIEQALEHLREVARISLMHDDPDEAIAALHQIIALAPDDPEPYHRLGEVLSAIGEYGQAERVYRRLASLLPDDPAVRAKQTALAALAHGHS